MKANDIISRYRKRIVFESSGGVILWEFMMSHILGEDEKDYNEMNMLSQNDCDTIIKNVNEICKELESNGYINMAEIAKKEIVSINDWLRMEKSKDFGGLN